MGNRGGPCRLSFKLCGSRFLWSDGADMVCVGDSASIGYLGFLDEFYCSRPFNFLIVGS